MRNALAFRLVIALGLLGLVAAAGPTHIGPARPVKSLALAQSASDELTGPNPSGRTAAKRLSTRARQAPKPARVSVTVTRPATRAPVHPRLRSTSMRRVSPLRPAWKPASKPAPRPKPPPPPPPPPPSGATNSAYEARILGLVNVARTSHGLAAVSMSSCADSYAESWSTHLAAIGALVHRSMSSLLSGCHAQYVGENIGYGAVSADTMVAMWMASSDHRANILNPRFTHIGIGAAQTSSGVWYAVQDFLDL